MADDADCAIDARGLYHIYQEGSVETVALRGTAITVERGTWTSVMGVSGSGKTTLLHVLAGMVVPSAGVVFVDGRDLAHLSAPERARWRRARVGVVLQYDNLHPLLDVAGNVSLPLRLEGRRRSERARRVPELLEQVKLTQRSGHRVSQLSGGEAQRAAIAVALALRPSVLLADEPTGELDEVTAGGVLDLLSDLRTEGTAVVTVTHNSQVAERASHRLTMSDGVLNDG